MIKVFISHQQADYIQAIKVAERLRDYHQISCYLDVIDTQLGKSGPDLATYLREEIGKCSHLLAITSYNTKDSQWVPWEIGIATEKDYPLATFAAYTSPVPEFLRAWPYLRTIEDVDAYARAAQSFDQEFTLRKSFSTEINARRFSSNLFFNNLRNDLNQPTIKASW